MRRFGRRAGMRQDADPDMSLAPPHIVGRGGDEASSALSPFAPAARRFHRPMAMASIVNSFDPPPPGDVLGALGGISAYAAVMDQLGYRPWEAIGLLFILAILVRLIRRQT